ncbi:MAG: mechanosensitive ion channel family protein [Thermoanaerobaculia bacterium]
MIAFPRPLQAVAENTERLKEELRSAPHDLREVATDLIDRFFRHLPGAITGIVVFFLFWLFARLAARLMRQVTERAHSDETVRDMLVPLTRFVVLTIGVLMALDQMGFEVSSLLAGLGIAGLAVGLAAQDTIANIFAGVAILWDGPFRLGDTVTMGGNQGQVSEIGLRSTRLRTADQREVILPNKDVIQQPIVNHSRSPAMRIDAAVQVAYGTAVERVREVLLAAARQSLPVLVSPEPQVLVTVLGESGVTVELRVWVEDPFSPASSRFLLLEVTQRALEEAGIEIPFPRRVLTMVDERAGR